MRTKATRRAQSECSQEGNKSLVSPFVFYVFALGALKARCWASPAGGTTFWLLLDKGASHAGCPPKYAFWTYC